MCRLARHVSLVLAVALIPSASGAPMQPNTPLAPVEILVAGFGSLWGVAVDAAGNVYVADADAGTVTSIAPDQRRVLVATGLQRPIGLAVGPNGELFIAEERADRVVRVEADGRRAPVMSDARRPRWLAVGDAGGLFVSARRLGRDAGPETGDESAQPETILTLGGAARAALFAGGFKQLEGLATGEGVVYAATRGRRDDARAAGVVFQIPMLADGSAGLPIQLGPSGAFKRPVGLARDRLGALYLTTGELDLDRGRFERAVGKLHQDGTATLFASSLDDPKGLAFDAEGNLYVAAGRSGRVVRFRAPAAPRLDALPPYTAHATLNVRGTTEPSARVDVFLNGETTPMAAVADAAGAFAASVALAPNTEHVLEIFATGHAGDGLTSSPAAARITHDGILPSLAFQAPPAAAFVSRTVPVAVQAGDGGSGLGSLALSVGAHALGGAVAPSLPAPVAAVTANWNTATSPDGAHLLVASAVDRAGNRAAVSRTVIVDNTAPDTQITGRPAETAQDTTVTFVFAGTDNLTPATSLAFAWRLDGGPWSAFASATSATSSGLSQGPHLFEVKARDLAGNEDPTPAQASFMASALRVTITEPTDGATVPAGLLLVRGEVEAGGQEVGIAVNGFVGAVHGQRFAVQVPVSPDVKALTATATAASGATAARSIAVTVSATTSPTPIFSAHPASGVAPLSVQFTLSGVTPASIALDLDGNGVIDVTGPNLQGRQFSYTQPGLHFSTATITDAQGGQVVLTTVVLVESPGAVTARFRAGWNSFKNRLQAADIPGALAHLGPELQGRFQEVFQDLGPALTTVAAGLGDVHVLEQMDDLAEAAVVQQQGGVPFLYFIYFRRDSRGRWRIEEM